MRGTKFIIVFLFAAIFVFLFLFSFHAYGATLSYEPASVNLTVGAGSSETVPLTVTIVEPGWRTYYLWFVSDVTGSLPVAWIQPTPSTRFVSSWQPSASTTLTVAIPAGTPSGTYSGYLFSKAMSAHMASPGTGVYMEISVPSGCSSVPEIEITSFGPEYIWPPNHSMEVVSVSGIIANPGGCSLDEIGYSINDEYGIYTSVGELSISGDGAFTAYIPVEAWRKGQDKDGRHYTITIFAENEAGIGTSETLNSIVPHDQRPENRP